MALDVSAAAGHQPLPAGTAGVLSAEGDRAGTAGPALSPGCRRKQDRRGIIIIM